MALTIRDPRQYSIIFPESNILINQALAELEAKNNDLNFLAALIEDLLKQSQDQLISVAYNLAPNQQVAMRIWQALQLALNSPRQDLALTFFALPVVLVVGSTTAVTLPSAIDASRLTQLLVAKHIVTDPDRCFISGNLYDYASLVKLIPSKLYQHQQEISCNDNTLFNHLVASPLASNGEEVHLRFLVGAYANEGSEAPCTLANYSALGLELMQLLSGELATSPAVIMPIPFAPVKLSEAAVVGLHKYHEIKLAVSLSSHVKRMRLDGHAPLVKLKGEDNAICIELWLHAEAKPREVLSWPLQLSDDFLAICTIVEGLLNDMQLPISYYSNDELAGENKEHHE